MQVAHVDRTLCPNLPNAILFDYVYAVDCSTKFLVRNANLSKSVVLIKTLDQFKRLIPPIGSNRIGPGIFQCSIEAKIFGQAVTNIVTINAITFCCIEVLPGDKSHQLIGKNNIDIGSKNKFSARSADSDIFRDHLKESEFIRILQPAMKRGRYRDHTRFAIRCLVRRTQDGSKSRPIGNGIPVDDDQLCGQAIFLTLSRKIIDEYLSPNQRVAAMIIITRSGDDGEIRCSISL